MQIEEIEREVLSDFGWGLKLFPERPIKVGWGIWMDAKSERMSIFYVGGQLVGRTWSSAYRRGSSLLWNENASQDSIPVEQIVRAFDVATQSWLQGKPTLVLMTCDVEGSETIAIGYPSN